MRKETFMKKFLPFVLIFVLSITGAVLADAPYEIFVSISGSDAEYTTSLIGNDGIQIAIRLGEESYTLTVEGKQAEGLNFSIDPALEFTDPQYGAATISAFLLPEGVKDEFAEIGPEKLTLTISWEQMELDPLYESLINDVASMLQGGESTRDDFSVIFRFLSAREEAKNAGFYVTDLDNDGTPELFLGEKQSESSVPVFYDLYTIENGTQFAINERPLGDGTVQVGIKVAADDTYTISALRNQFQSIVLVDNETGIETDLTNASYTFQASKGSSENRFMLRIGGTVVTDVQSVNVAQQTGQTYNLQGQRIDVPQKGLYIMNGKKVIK